MEYNGDAGEEVDGLRYGSFFDLLVFNGATGHCGKM